MSLANKMAGAARAAVDNARKTADQALHDRATLRRRVGSTVRDAPLTAVKYTMKGVGQAMSLGGRVRQGLGDVRSSGPGGLMTRFTRRDADEQADTAPAGTDTGRSAFERAAEAEGAFDTEVRPEGVRPARRARSSRPADAPGTTSTGPDNDADTARTTDTGTAGAGAAGVTGSGAADTTAADTTDTNTGTADTGTADTTGADATATGAATPGAAAAGTGGAGADLPVPEYDSRTVASLRARMRGLSLDDIRRLLEYERGHAARPEVVGMFERRIAKLEAE